MTGRPHTVWWSAHPQDRPDDGADWIVIGEGSFQEAEHRITGLDRLPGRVPGWADDLFRIARTAFIADKRIRRTTVPDR